MPVEVTITMNQVGCARCDGNGHANMTYRQLTHPVVLEGILRFTHWALCPTNGEPIMLLVNPVEELT